MHVTLFMNWKLSLITYIESREIVYFAVKRRVVERLRHGAVSRSISSRGSLGIVSSHLVSPADHRGEVEGAGGLKSKFQWRFYRSFIEDEGRKDSAYSVE